MNSSLLVIAGEVSGDQHAAALVRALRRRRPDLDLWGIGGDELGAAGVHLIRHVREMESLGFTDVIRRFPFFRRVFRETLDRALARRPTLAVLVDYPGFNLRMARALHALGVRVVYYICPQVWAWKKSRARILVENVARLLVIFPFEVEFFRGQPLAVEFVGHPLVDAIRSAAEPPDALPWRGEPRIAVLPGSRRSEIERLLPPMLEAAAALARERPAASFLVAAAHERAAGWIRAAAARAAATPPQWDIVTGRARRILREARAGWVASGTATLEAALLGCPHVLAYRVSWLNYQIARRLIRVPHLGIVNLIAGRTVCPEILQYAMTPQALADALRPLLDDTPARAAMLADMARVAESLGDGGAAERAAAAVAEEMAVAERRPAARDGGAGRSDLSAH